MTIYVRDVGTLSGIRSMDFDVTLNKSRLGDTRDRNGCTKYLGKVMRVERRFDKTVGSVEIVTTLDKQTDAEGAGVTTMRTYHDGHLVLCNQSIGCNG